MRVSAMTARGEDVFASVARTMTDFWPGHDVVPGKADGGQVWWLHPALSLCSHRPGSAARQYLRHAQRWSHRPARVLPQLLASRAIASRIGLRLLRQAAFTVTAGRLDASNLLVMPSNQRVRVLDFAGGRTQVIAKAGLGPEGIQRELELRSGDGPWMPAVRLGERAFEEELLQGWPLPRRPPWRSAKPGVDDALARVEAWQSLDATPFAAQGWAEMLAERLRAGLPAEVHSRVPLRSLVTAAGLLGEVEVSSTHGDLQPGNLILQPDGHVVVIDWERAARRWRPYDRWVWDHGVRWGGQPPATASRGELALFWLEELCFFLDEANAFPGDVATSSLRARGEVVCASWR